MARTRKRHIQQSLLLALDKNGQRRGGKRPGAGRPPKGPRSSEPHKRRAPITKRQAAHAVLRTARRVGRLRTRDIYRALRKAIVTTLSRTDFRIVHISLQGTHVHVLAEADDQFALARGMKAFEISAARRINAALSRRSGEVQRGTVFPDRYHVEIIKTPRQARHALSYVLNNWRKHGESQLVVANGWLIDPYSSAPSFTGWRDIDATAIEWPCTYEPLPVCQPETWLLRVGWQKHGLIGSREVPSRNATARRVAR